MLKFMIEKELKAILLSPKFAATFAVCSLLIVASVWLGLREYKTAQAQYESATRLVNEEMRQATNWMSVQNRIYRKPDPMQIFVSGIANDLGRWSPVNSTDAIKLRNSIYSDDPIFAVFRFVDLAFIVQIVLSLFALLFTYDSINGEREGGTLQLVFSNPVARAQYILAKGIGAWIGLAAPLLIPVALSLLMVQVAGVHLTAGHWLSISLFGVSSLLLFTFFMCLGLLLSAIIKRSNVSFLAALVCWVVLVLILPRIGVIVAGSIIPVPTAAEIDGQADTYAKDRWEAWKKTMNDRWETRNAATRGMSNEESEAYRQDHMWNWMEEEDAERKNVEKDIDANRARLQEDIRNRSAFQQRLAFSLARLSPVSAYQLSVMDLAGTDIAMKTRFEDALGTYRPTFTSYTDKKQKENGGVGGIRITVDTQKGFHFEMGRESGAMDISDMPEFQAIDRSPGESAKNATVDIGLVGGFILISFAGAFISFLKQDIR